MDEDDYIAFVTFNRAFVQAEAQSTQLPSYLLVAPGLGKFRFGRIKAIENVASAISVVSSAPDEGLFVPGDARVAVSLVRYYAPPSPLVGTALMGTLVSGPIVEGTIMGHVFMWTSLVGISLMVASLVGIALVGCTLMRTLLVGAVLMNACWEVAASMISAGRVAARMGCASARRALTGGVDHAPTIPRFTTNNVFIKLLINAKFMKSHGKSETRLNESGIKTYTRGTNVMVSKT